jgi:hypothetical protein
MSAPIDFTVRSNVTSTNVSMDYTVNPAPLIDYRRHTQLLSFAIAVTRAAQDAQESDPYFTDPNNSIVSKLNQAVDLMDGLAVSKQTSVISRSDWATRIPS